MSKLEKVKTLIELGEQKQALMKIKKLLKQNGSNENIQFEYARLLMFNPKTVDKGIELMTKLANGHNNYALLELGKCEKIKGNLFLARTYFNELITFPNKSTCFALGIKELIYLDILEEKYEDAYIFLNQNFEILKKIDDANNVYNIKYYLEYKLGKLTKTENPTNYFCKQLVDYNKYEVINHIGFHLIGDDKQKIQIVFNDININDLYRKCSNYINDKNPLFSNLPDVYLAKCNGIIGSINGKETDLIFITTIINTKNIIAIRPTIYDYYMENDTIKLFKQKKYYK